LLSERLEEVAKIRREGLPGVEDKARAAATLANQGIGATAVLIQLGAIAGSEWNSWIKRFLDAAGVAYQPWSSSVGLSMWAEGGPDDGESNDDDRKDES
jgi:hypothetical protein